MVEKFFRWLFFGVIIAMLPIAFHYICLFLGKSSPSITKVISNGELLIIAVGMTSAAIGELFAWQSQNSIYKVILGGSCTTLLILSALLFAYISTNIFSQHPLDPISIYHVSLVLYFSSVISSAFSTTITESRL